MQEKFQNVSTENKTKKNKSVPCWTDSLIIMWKRINALIIETQSAASSVCFYSKQQSCFIPF